MAVTLEVFKLALAAFLIFGGAWIAQQAVHLAFRPRPKHLAGRTHQRRADDAIGDWDEPLDQLLKQWRAEYLNLTNTIIANKPILVDKHRAPGDPNRIELEPDDERTDDHSRAGQA